MKIFALFLSLSCTLCCATSVEYRVVAALKASEAHVQLLLAEIRSDHRGNPTFIAAFDGAQKKWNEYCAEMLALRFPETKKREVYGSADYLAFAAARREMLDARIKDLLPLLKAKQPDSNDVAKKND